MSKNDITGDNIVSKGLSEQGRENFDRIFCKHDWCSDGDPGPGEVMTLTCSRCGKEQKAVPVGMLGLTHVGTFDTVEQAMKARDVFRRELLSKYEDGV